MRALTIIFLSSAVLGCIYLAALLKHAKSSGLALLSRDNMLGTLPLFFVVVGIAVFVVIGLMLDKRSSKDSEEGSD